MNNLGLVLEVFAFVCFVMACIPLGSPRAASPLPLSDGAAA